MSGSSGRALRNALDLRLSELARLDLMIALTGGAGGAALALIHPEALTAVLPLAVGLVGVVVGAVVAGIALQAAFFDSPFLRKIKAIGYEPVYFLGNLLFTVVLGVAAALFALVASSIPVTAPGWLLGPVTGLTGLLVFWTIASVLPDLATLVEFVELKSDAAQIPDDFDAEERPAVERAGRAP